MTTKARRGVWIAAWCIYVAALPAQGETPVSSPIPDGQRVLVLPADFRYMLSGAKRIEPMREETATLSAVLGAELDRSLANERSFQPVKMPELTEDEAALLKEHLTLLRVAELNAIGDLQRPGQLGARWRESDRKLDYSIGPGLSWLADRAGTDMAMLVSALRFQRTFGSTFERPNVGFPASVNVPLRSIDAVFIDLRSGNFIAIYFIERGFWEAFDDRSDGLAAGEWMARLFDAIPHAPIDTPPKTIHPVESKEWNELFGRNFAVTNPVGWSTDVNIFGLQAIRRAAGRLEYIDIHGYKRTSSDALSADFSKNALEAIRDFRLDRNTRLWFKDIETVAVSPAKVAGRDGFRAELTSLCDFAELPFRMRHVIYGVNDQKKTYVLRLDAPAIYFYDHHLPEFESMVASFRLTGKD